MRTRATILVLFVLVAAFAATAFAAAPPAPPAAAPQFPMLAPAKPAVPTPPPAAPQPPAAIVPAVPALPPPSALPAVPAPQPPAAKPAIPAKPAPKPPAAKPAAPTPAPKPTAPKPVAKPSPSPSNVAAKPVPKTAAPAAKPAAKPVLKGGKVPPVVTIADVSKQLQALDKKVDAGFKGVNQRIDVVAKDVAQTRTNTAYIYGQTTEILKNTAALPSMAQALYELQQGLTPAKKQALQQGYVEVWTIGGASLIKARISPCGSTIELDIVDGYGYRTPTLVGNTLCLNGCPFVPYNTTFEQLRLLAK